MKKYTFREVTNIFDEYFRTKDFEFMKSWENFKKLVGEHDDFKLEDDSLNGDWDEKN